MPRRPLAEVLAACEPPSRADVVIDLRSAGAASPEPAASTPDAPSGGTTATDTALTSAPTGPTSRSVSARGGGRTIMQKEFGVDRAQHRQLGDLLYEINSRRTDRTERLCTSTLVRIAIDALLEHSAALHGNTEAELADSLHRHLRRAFSSP